MKHRFRHLLDDNDEGDDAPPPTTITTFTYDAADRLVEVRQHDRLPDDLNCHMNRWYDPNEGRWLD